MELYVNKGRGYVEAEMHPADRVAAGGPGAHRRHLQSGAARQLRGRRDPRRPAHRLRPAHGPGRDQRHHHARGRHRLRGRARAGALPVLRGLRQGAHHAGRRRRRRRGRRRQPAPAPGPADRRLRPLGALAQLAQELEHPDPQGSGRVHRGRPAQGQERGREGAERDRRAARPRRAQLRHGVRGCRRRAARAAAGRSAAPPTRPPAAERGSNAASRQGPAALPHVEPPAGAAQQHGHQPVRARPGRSPPRPRPRSSGRSPRSSSRWPAAATCTRAGWWSGRSRIAETLSRLFSEIGPRFAARPGGYTRILKLGHREGDGADIARIELLSE